MEVVDRTLTTMIWSIVGDKPKSWYSALAQVEFAFNNMENRSTGYTLFALMNTKHPNVVVDLREL